MRVFSFRSFFKIVENHGNPWFQESAKESIDIGWVFIEIGESCCQDILPVHKCDWNAWFGPCVIPLRHTPASYPKNDSPHRLAS